MWWRMRQLIFRPRANPRDVTGVTTSCGTTRCPLPLHRAPPSPTSACASQHSTANKSAERHQTPHPACAVEQDVRQPLAFTAPPPPAPAQVVIFARTSMGPHSTQVTIALAGQRHVTLSMACIVMLLLICAQLFRRVLRQTALSPTLDRVNVAM